MLTPRIARLPLRGKYPTDRPWVVRQNLWKGFSIDCRHRALVIHFRTSGEQHAQSRGGRPAPGPRETQKHEKKSIPWIADPSPSGCSVEIAAIGVETVGYDAGRALLAQRDRVGARGRAGGRPRSARRSRRGGKPGDARRHAALCGSGDLARAEGPRGLDRRGAGEHAAVRRQDDPHRDGRDPGDVPQLAGHPSQRASAGVRLRSRTSGRGGHARPPSPSRKARARRSPGSTISTAGFCCSASASTAARRCTSPSRSWGGAAS